MHRLGRGVAEQAGAVRRRRRFELLIVLEQAGHAGRISGRRGGPLGARWLRWEAGRTTRAETRCGCFLPDLTGLARRPSAADLPGVHIMLLGGGDKATLSLQSVTGPH